MWRAATLAHAGRVQLPYREDTNSGVAMFESSAIVDDLEQRHALPARAGSADGQA